jgi:hypothetical protein
MNCNLIAVVFWLAAACPLMAAESRVWSDTTGEYTLEGKLIALGESTVVLQRADHELVAIPIDKLSQKDRDYLTSKEARAEADKLAEAAQTWTLRDDTKLVGRLVDYARRDLTIQRRRGRIYVNDRRFESLPEFYQQLVPKIVADREMLPRADRRSFENWVLQQRGQPRTFQVEGIVVELENGDEYAVPFALLTDDDLKVLKPGWDEWLAAHSSNKYAETEDLGFLLRSLAAARQQDQMVQREIARMQLKRQAVEAGVTSLWEVTLYPTGRLAGPPQWVVVAGRDSRQATANALAQFPGYAVGPVRRVSRR